MAVEAERKKLQDKVTRLQGQLDEAQRVAAQQRSAEEAARAEATAARAEGAVQGSNGRAAMQQLEAAECALRESHSVATRLLQARFLAARTHDPMGREVNEGEEHHKFRVALASSAEAYRV